MTAGGISERIGRWRGLSLGVASLALAVSAAVMVAPPATVSNADAAADRGSRTSVAVPAADWDVRIYYYFWNHERGKNRRIVAVARDGTFHFVALRGRRAKERYVCLRPRVKDTLFDWVKRLVRSLPDYLQGRPTRGTYAQRLELFSPAGRRPSEGEAEAHQRGYFGYEARWNDKPRPPYPLSRLVGRLHKLLERHEKHGKHPLADETTLC